MGKQAKAPSPHGSPKKSDKPVAPKPSNQGGFSPKARGPSPIVGNTKTPPRAPRKPSNKGRVSPKTAPSMTPEPDTKRAPAPPVSSVTRPKPERLVPPRKQSTSRTTERKAPKPAPVGSPKRSPRAARKPSNSGGVSPGAKNPSMMRLKNADGKLLRVRKTGKSGWRTNSYYVWYTDKDILFGKKPDVPTGETWPSTIEECKTSHGSLKAQFEVSGKIRTLTFDDRDQKNRFLAVCATRANPRSVQGFLRNDDLGSDSDDDGL